MTQEVFYMLLPKARPLHMTRILDRFSPYIKGLKSGGQVRKYKDKKMRNIMGALFILNLLCTISKKHPKEKLSREAR